MTLRPHPTTGVFGGSFDPIHVGHLILARDVLEQVKLQRILFIPSSRSPLTEEPPRASGKDRLDLVRASIADEPAFKVSDLEIRDGGVNYTINTIEALRAEHPGDCFSMIIGGDQLEQLHKWEKVKKLIELTEFICLERSGFTTKAHAELVNFRSHPIKPRIVEISSTEIRHRIRNNFPVQNLVPEPAFKLIRERGLYGYRKP